MCSSCAPKDNSVLNMSREDQEFTSNKCPAMTWITMIAKQTKIKRNGDWNCDGKKANLNCLAKYPKHRAEPPL